MSKKKIELKVTITYNEDDITTILKGINTFGIEDKSNPITAEEVINNPKMLKYMISELELCKNEIVDGSYEASANDWLCDIQNYRK